MYNMRIKGYYHRLEITNETPYCLKGSFASPLKYQEAIEKVIDKMLRFSVTERATSPYINPIIMVIKKEQSIRLCLDARRLTSVTVPDFE